MPDGLARARDLQARGDWLGAREAYLSLVAAEPAHVDALFEGAVACLRLGRRDESLDLLRRARTLAPARVDVLVTLAQAARAAGEGEEALEAASAALQLEPGFAPAWMLRGSVEFMTGQPQQGEASLRRALSLAPSLAEAWHYLGESLQAQRRWDEAAAAYRQAMRAQPTEVFNVGLCEEQAGHWGTARASYQRMCQLQPLRADCLARLAQVEAKLCDFDGEARTVAKLAARLDAADTLAHDDHPEPFALSWLPLSATQRRAAMARYAARIQARAGAPLPPATAARDGRIRLGYIGADFGRHAVGTLLRGLFAAHDRSRFEVVAYSLRHHDDDIARALRRECDAFHDVSGEASAVIARRIRDDRIDVLVDLGGYTHGARPEVLALRPAPLQWGWLGFIHAHEAPWLDALLFDAGVLPEGAPWPYSDRVLRLPGYLMPCGPLPSGTPDRARFGLPQDVPLLASFNNSYKIDAELLDAWIGILRRAPQAHLALYLPGAARQQFLAHWRARGGDSQRLHLLEHLPEADQADRAASCDLFLDAFRYQAGATALACVAAGLPLLSREGDTPLARLGSGLSRFLGLDDLVCADTADYVERAVTLAGDRERLRQLRERLRDAARHRRLFDPRRGAEAIEQLVLSQLAARGRAQSP